MDSHDAEKVVQIMLALDCPSCVTRLLNRFSEEFPEHEQMVGKAWTKEFRVEWKTGFTLQ